MLSVEVGRRYWYHWACDSKAESGRCIGVCGEKLLFECPYKSREARVVKLKDVYAESPEVAVIPWWKFW